MRSYEPGNVLHELADDLALAVDQHDRRGEQELGRDDSVGDFVAARFVAEVSEPREGEEGRDQLVCQRHRRAYDHAEHRHVEQPEAEAGRHEERRRQRTEQRDCRPVAGESRGNADRHAEGEETIHRPASASRWASGSAWESG